MKPASHITSHTVCFYADFESLLLQWLYDDALDRRDTKVAKV